MPFTIYDKSQCNIEMNQIYCLQYNKNFDLKWVMELGAACRTSMWSFIIVTLSTNKMNKCTLNIL